MAENHDFKKDWEKTKVQLQKLSKEAAKAAKKGEEQLVKFSRRSKLHIDSTAMTLKKEQLFYRIGKEYVSLKEAGIPSVKLKKLVSDLDNANKEQSTIKDKLKDIK